MVLVVRARLVVKAVEVERRLHVVPTVEVCGHGALPVRIEAVEEAVHALRVAERVGCRAQLLVANRPDDDARVVAVAQHEIRELPVLSIAMIFIPNEHSHLVRCVEQPRVGRIVRSAPTVRAHLLKLRDAVRLEDVGDCNAGARKILVVRVAFDLDVDAVEPEAGVGAPLRLPHTDARRNRVVAVDGARHSVQVRRLDAPQLGARQRDVRQRRRRVGPRRDARDAARRRTDRLARRVRHVALDRDRARGGAAGVHDCERRQHDTIRHVLRVRRIDRADDEGRGVDAAVHREVERRLHDELDVAVDPAAIVPPTVRLRGVRFNGEHDARAAAEARRSRRAEDVAEGCVAGGVHAERLSVEVRRRCGLDAVEDECREMRPRGEPSVRGRER